MRGFCSLILFAPKGQYPFDKRILILTYVRTKEQSPFDERILILTYVRTKEQSPFDERIQFLNSVRTKGTITRAKRSSLATRLCTSLLFLCCFDAVVIDA